MRPQTPSDILAQPIISSLLSRLESKDEDKPMASYNTVSIDLGPLSDFAKLPAPVEVRGWSYFLAQSRKGVYQLLSNVCPHRASPIVDWNGVFMCPDHGWRFEYTEGVCVNGPNARMVGFPVAVEDGRLIAELPDDFGPNAES